MATYLQLCQQMRREVGISRDGVLTSTASTAGQIGEVVALIAKAELEIQTKWKDWRFRWGEVALTTVIGQEEYDSGDAGWPAALSSWNPWAFTYNSGTTSAVSLQDMPFDEWRRKLKNAGATNSTPAFSVIKPDDGIILWPPPDAAVTLYGEYVIRPTALSGDATVSTIPVEFHDIIVARAKMMWAEANEAPEIFQSASQDYMLWLQRLEANSLPNRLRDDWSERERQLVVEVC